MLIINYVHVFLTQNVILTVQTILHVKELMEVSNVNVILASEL